MGKPFIYWIYLSFTLLTTWVHCESAGSVCKITNNTADCSHLKLTQIPSDLPTNITVLDLSHNQLKTLPPANLTKYGQLVYLDVGFNTISKLHQELCLNLPFLKVLKLGHNQLHKFPDDVFIHCGNLKELNLGFNILEIRNEPFINLKFHPGCFRAIGNLYGLLLNNVPLGPDRTKNLSSELSGTRIQNLSLSHVQLSQISNSTFSGMKETNLTILDLSKNDLSHIENGSFVYFENLESLNLMNNNIKYIYSHSFYGLHNVNYLNLENSNIKKINDSAFQWLKHLGCLIMDGNKLLEITPNTFKGLENLKNLSLSECNVTVVTEKTFSSLANSSLQFLNLTKCGITYMKARAFSWLGQLTSLDLGLNNIKQDLTGHEFQGLSNIETLYLSYNSHLNLTSESFTFTPSLRKLRLRKTGCTNLDISPSPFRKLSNLTILDLGNNNIANMRGEIFDGLHQLEILDLQHNNLDRLWKHANPDGPVLFLKGLRNLRLLDLESNGFDEIPGKAFSGLSQLRSLNFGKNNFNLFPKFVFDELASLSSLFLEKNLITAVDEKVFGRIFTNLKEINMEGNPFDCTCDSIAWFVNWLNGSRTYIQGLNNYICNTPSKYHANRIIQFDTSPCDSAPFKLVYIVSTSLVLLLIFVVLLIHFEGWRIKFLWSVTVNRVFGHREDRPLLQFDYDAYIIHAKKDRNWVSKNFIPLEENSQPEIRFCLEERDFEAGISEFEAIIDSIKRSRKIIFVVTEHLLKDPWCKRFKVYHAIQQAIEQSRDSIILVFRHDIPDYKLKNALCLRRAMFKSRCILEWPVQKDRHCAFYQQLKLALKTSSRVL
nr:toll-like receptor 3 isoform X2 [Zootoca vivipara]